MTKNLLIVFLKGLSLLLLSTSLSSVAVASTKSTHRNLKSTKTTASDGVSFKNLTDGQTVQSPFKAIMQVRGKAIAVAGEKIDDQTVGHHHILVNQDSIPQGQPIPADETHLHFGKGQTETELKLPAGKHKLTLQLADGAHRSFGPAWSQTITVLVQ